MRNRAQVGVVLLGLAQGLAGCGSSGPSPTPPTAPSSVSPAPIPPPLPPPTGSFAYGAGYVLVEASLSGVVFEMTQTGQVPVPDVSVYCDACGEVGHTWQTTDAAGFYKFSGDVARGGGMWLSPANTAYLIVKKDGYRDPPVLNVTVKGDTSFDIQLVRR
jgi:hypothetical protein